MTSDEELRGKTTAVSRYLADHADEVHQMPVRAVLQVGCPPFVIFSPHYLYRDWSTLTISLPAEDAAILEVLGTQWVADDRETAVSPTEAARGATPQAPAVIWHAAV